jgi:hypothetical protein
MKSKTKIVLFVLVGVVLLGACRKSATNQNSAPAAATPLPETVGGGTAPAGEKFYFRGRIAYELKIEMTLVRESETITGTYFYPRVGKNIELKGSVDKDGNVDLREADESGKETGKFKGKWKSNQMGLAEIEGKWSRPDGSKETDFQVSQQPIEFTGAVRVVPKVIRETNKELRYSLDTEYPQIEADSRFDKFNREARAMIAKDVAAFKSAEAGPASDEDIDLPAETQNSTLDIGYQIRLATDNLISIEFHQGQYSRGAAHGNSITTVLNYDVKNGKKLALADLFNPKSNYLSTISAYCIKDLKEQNKRDKESMLEGDMIQSGASARADNYQAWTITKKGLWIVFDPYQVAAYAAGPQYVLVPYSALKPLIKPDGPVAGFAG